MKREIHVWKLDHGKAHSAYTSFGVHGRSTMKDDCERFGDGPFRELKEKSTTCNKISKLYEASVSINDEQTMIAID